MFKHLFRRIFLLLFILFSLTILSFSLSYMFPGTPLDNMSGYQDLIEAEETRAELVKRYKLDQNKLVQYIAYVERVLSGDFGMSITSKKPIFDEILQVFPATIELSMYALFVSVLLGIPLGIIAALQQGKLLGKFVMTAALIGYSLPVFWWALIAILLFSLDLGWFPTSGRISLLYEIPFNTGFVLIDILQSDSPYRYEAFIDALRHMLLPTLVLATFPTTVMIRFTRNSMKQVLDQSYVKSAKAKGLSTFEVLLRHGLRNTLIPIIRQMGLQFSTLITLAMITEVIFSWPGIGRWLVESIYQRDYPAIQAGLLLVGTFVIVATTITDILYELSNPLSRKQLYGKV